MRGSTVIARVCQGLHPRKEVEEGSLPHFPVLRCEHVNMLCSFVCYDGAKSDVLQVKPREQERLGAAQLLWKCSLTECLQKELDNDNG